MVLIERNSLLNEDVTIDNQNLIVVNNTVPLNITPDGVHDHSINTINNALRQNGLNHRLECIRDPNNPNNLLLRYTPPPPPQRQNNRGGNNQHQHIDRNIQDFLNNNSANVERLLNDYIMNNPDALLNQTRAPRRPSLNDYFDANYRRITPVTIEIPSLGLRDIDIRNVVNQMFPQNNNVRITLLPGDIISITYNRYGISDQQAEILLDQIRRHSLNAYNINYADFERARNMRTFRSNGFSTPDPNQNLLHNVRTFGMNQNEVEDVLRREFSNNSMWRRVRNLPPQNPQPFNGIIDPIQGSPGNYNILFNSEEEATRGLNAIRREIIRRNSNPLQGPMPSIVSINSFVCVNVRNVFRKGISLIKGHPTMSKIGAGVLGVYAATEMYNRFFSSANKIVRNQALIHEQNMNKLVVHSNNQNLSPEVKKFLNVLIDQERELVLFLRNLPDELDSTIDKNQALSVYFKTMRDTLINRRKYFIILTRSKTLNNDDKIFINDCKAMLDLEDKEFELQYKAVLIESGKLSEADVSILPQAEKLSQQQKIVKTEQTHAESKTVWNYFNDFSSVRNFSILLGGSVIIYLFWKYKDKIKEKLINLKNKLIGNNDNDDQIQDDRPAYD